jgi:hypothetical protein
MCAAFGSNEYSGGGGYSAQYSMPPPQMQAGDNNYGSGQAGYNQSYSNQSSGQDWNQQNTGK